jgi:hypothetical protein
MPFTARLAELPSVADSTVSETLARIACPGCGELLEYELRYGPLVFLSSIVIAVIFPYWAGYSGVGFALSAVIAAIFSLFILLGVVYHLSPPKVRRSTRLGDTRLDLRSKNS